ncbi:hypothetical protein CEXT_73861 [Caerostris extrusa]|uniref:Uncharacterized protein n=1 Tax=Caerostris extrusa TaxID=172846 RepID=A0AAV4PBM7_CAEEX|nr:hypothetical protein CEXT_73861 [Caerostris extrusa]
MKNPDKAIVPFCISFFLIKRPLMALLTHAVRGRTLLSAVAGLPCDKTRGCLQHSQSVTSHAIRKYFVDIDWDWRRMVDECIPLVQDLNFVNEVEFIRLRFC